MRAENMQPPVPDQVAMQQHVDHLFLDCMHGLVELAWTDPDDGAPRHANLFLIIRDTQPASASIHAGFGRGGVSGWVRRVGFGGGSRV